MFLRRQSLTTSHVIQRAKYFFINWYSFANNNQLSFCNMKSQLLVLKFFIKCIYFICNWEYHKILLTSFNIFYLGWYSSIPLHIFIPWHPFWHFHHRYWKQPDWPPPTSPVGTNERTGSWSCPLRSSDITQRSNRSGVKERQRSNANI